MARVMAITTPLGDDVLLFHGMRAREEISRVPEFQLDLLSTQGDIKLADILGKNVTVTLTLPDDSPRHFNGFVTRFSQGGKVGRYHRYYAIVRPWLWLTSRTADCRIFQESTVEDILKQVFSEHPTNDYKFELTGSYKTWTYCVQYRETDLNFISRLLEHEGMYYYFKYEDGKNTLVITDSYSGHATFPTVEAIQYMAPERVARPDIEHISSWDHGGEVQPGTWAQTDYDFEKPSVNLRTQKIASIGFQPSAHEVFDYPGHYIVKGDGDHYASVRIDEYASQFATARGLSNVRGLAVGYLFTLDDHPRDDQNGEHLVLSARTDFEFSDYEAMPERGGAAYNCSFVAMSSKQQYRPRRLTPKPFVQGPQTAMVVGPAGDEIYTDKYGRVKVQFHWDRLGKKDENSSCWIRVSQPWAGKGWGSVSTPRIGQEVIVDFLEGDPDQPIITGRVYNAEALPPFGFPAGAVLSGIKSQTHKGAGYNEMSMDDTAGKEKITVHGQYDMNTTVEHDQTDEIKNNRTSHVVVNDTLNVDADRTMHVKGKLAETVDAGHELTVTAGYTETITGGATRTIDGDHTETVKGKREMTVTGPIDQSATATIDIHATGAGTYSSDASLTLTVKGSVIEITPGGITISHGGSSIKVDPAGVTVMGPKISLNG